MRYLSTEVPKLIGKFTHGDTVTIDIYKLSDNSKVVSASSCTELATTGYYYYESALAPTSFEMYLWIMTNGDPSKDVYGELDLNGYPKTIADNIGTPVALDSGLATLSGMLTKIADDNGGADFDAEHDSLHTLETKVTDAIWDEPVSGHAVAASFGKYLDSDISANTDHISADYGTTEKAAIDLLDDVSTGTLHTRIADAVWDEAVAAHTTVDTYGSYIDTELTSVISGVLLGTGTLACTYTLTLSDNGMPISGARVIVSTDGNHANIVASGITDQYGIVSFNLDAGTVYLWRYKSGVNFSNPIVATFSDLALSAVGTGTLVETESSSRIRKASFVGSS
jgi:hypothetical protein